MLLSSTLAALQAEARSKLGDSKGSAQAYESALATKPAGDFELLQGLVSSLLADSKPQKARHSLLVGSQDARRCEAGIRRQITITGVHTKIGSERKVHNVLTVWLGFM